MTFAPITPDTAARAESIATAGWPFISAIAWSRDGALLCAAGAHGIALWRDGFGPEPDTQFAADVPLKDAAFSPDGRQLATAGAYAFIDLWDTASGGHVGGIQPSDSAQAAYDAVAWSPDGATLAFGGVDRILYVWDVWANRLRHRLEGHGDEITSAAFSADSSLLISGSWDGTVRLWDVQTGAPAGRLDVLDWVRHVAVSTPNRPGGALIGATGKDGSARLWRLSDHVALHTLAAHERGADCIAFNPDGSLVVTGGRDGALRLWSTETGALLAERQAHTRPMLAAAFHPRGHLLISGGGDNHLHLWAVGQ